MSPSIARSRSVQKIPTANGPRKTRSVRSGTAPNRQGKSPITKRKSTFFDPSTTQVEQAEEVGGQDEEPRRRYGRPPFPVPVTTQAAGRVPDRLDRAGWKAPRGRPTHGRASPEGAFGVSEAERVVKQTEKGDADQVMIQRLSSGSSRSRPARSFRTAREPARRGKR